MNKRHVSVTTLNPNNIQFNPTNGTKFSQIARYLLFEPLAQYNYLSGQFEPRLAKSWEFTGDAFNITIRDDVTWSNGDKVTAKDVATHLKIMKYDGAPMWSWASGVTVNSKTELTIKVGKDVNPALVESDVLDRRLIMGQPTYGEKLKALENGNKKIKNVRGFADKDPVTNGPFTLKKKDSQIMLTERFPDSPFASNINFKEYAFRFLKDNNARHAALKNLKVDSDYSVGASKSTFKSFPDAVKQVKTPDIWGMGLAPNHNRPFLEDRSVRQAIQYAIDRKTVVKNSAPSYKTTPKVATGIATDYQKKWLGDEMGKFETYGMSKKATDKAAAVLKEDGYSKSGGTWQDSGGNPVSFDIVHPQGWGDWTLGLETVVSHLNSFGFDVSLKGTGDYFGVLPTGEWDVIANTWLHGGPTAYPYYSLLHQLYKPQVQNAHNNYPGYTEQFGGSSASITVPARSGSGTIEVSPGDRLDELSKTTDSATEKEIVRELAWVANQDLPRIPLVEKNLQQWLTADDWDIPSKLSEDPDANVNWANTRLPRVGKMNYKK